MKTLIFIVTAAALSGVIGCGSSNGNGDQPGIMDYSMGTLSVVLEDDVEDIYNAGMDTLDEMEVNVTSKDKDDLSAQIIGRTADDKKLTIEVFRIDEDLSRMSIRIGTLGSEAQTRYLYDKILEKL